MEKLLLFVKKIPGTLKSLLRRRFFLILLIIVSAVVALVFLFPYEKFLSPSKHSTSTTEKALTIIAPPEAFGHEKSFSITKVTSEEIASFNGFSPFAGDIYSVTPSDGIDEFAVSPIKMRYYLPSKLYFGEQYANVRLAYIPLSASGVYRILGGAEIDMDEKGPYIEAQAFHASKIGLIADVPEKQLLGLSLINDNPESVEPVLLLVPGADANFIGYVSSLNSLKANFWSEAFPTRTIMYYSYPVSSTKSKLYVDGFKQFSREKGINSVILFEAEKLAAELKRLSGVEFDIVAHGIGGLIARAAIEMHPEIKNIRKIALLSVPNLGTNIPNPVYYGSLLYNKSSQVLSSIWNIEIPVIEGMKSHILTYIESIGPLYKEILPNSETLRMISSLQMRKDIEYLFASGSNPPMSIDVTGTELEKFYPELISTKGDGIVSHASALLKGANTAVFDGSFFDFYTSRTFFEKLKMFLKHTPPEVPPYESDSYPEKLPDKKSSSDQETYSEPASDESKEWIIKVPESFSFGNVMKEKSSIPANNLITAGMVNDTLYLVKEDGVYQGEKLLLSGYIRFFHRPGHNIISFLDSNSRPVFIDTRGTHISEPINISNNIQDVLVTPTDIYAIVKNNSSLTVLRKSGERWEKLLNTRGEYGTFVDSSEGIFIVTNSEIYQMDNGTFLKLLDSSQIQYKNESVDFESCFRYGSILMVGLRTHSLIVFNLESKHYVRIAEGWVDAKKILQTASHIIIIGSKSMNFIDKTSMSLLEVTQPFNTQIEDAFVQSSDIYLIFKDHIRNYSLNDGDVGE